MWSAKSNSVMLWTNAVSYCDNLNEGGYSDWHLPSIRELRTLIINCKNTEIGCEIKCKDTEKGEECDKTTAGLDYSCDGCDYDSSGKYSKFGDNDTLWSSSVLENQPHLYAWAVSFYSGSIIYLADKVSGQSSVRCVRNY